jgi:hypothetical protein
VRVVDARSGRTLTPGETVVYDDGYVWRLIGVEQVSFGVARFTVHLPTGAITTVDGPIRRTHPKYLFEKVAFVPT